MTRKTKHTTTKHAVRIPFTTQEYRRSMEALDALLRATDAAAERGMTYIPSARVLANLGLCRDVMKRHGFFAAL